MLLNAVMAFIAGGALASLPAGAPFFASRLSVVVVGASVAAVLSLRLRIARPLVTAERDPPAPFDSLLERVAPWLLLVFFVPLLTMAVAPGADMAMHVALGRALTEPRSTLSPAWPGVTVAIYERGFSAWVAFFSWPFGWAAAGLITSALAYVVFALASARLFRDLFAVRQPLLLATVMVFLAKAPASFFAWGGNPTILALALGLTAVAVLAAHAGERPWASAALATMLLTGAVAIHPLGALAAAVLLPWLAWRLTPARTIVLTVGIGTVLAIFAAFLYHFGPVVSTNELEWMRHYQAGPEHVLAGPWWAFPLTVWSALGRQLGDPYVAVLGAAAVIGGCSRFGRQTLALALAGVGFVAAVMAIGAQVPVLGAMFYQARLVPLWAVLTAPLIESARVGLGPPVARPVAFGLLAVGLGYHWHVYERALPMATSNDVAAIRCAAEQVSETAMIDGEYGDASQWIPALIGRSVTQPHRHCSLFDESAPMLVPAARSDPVGERFQFVGERLRYVTDTALPAPRGPAFCQVGGAAFYRSDVSSERAP